MVPRTGFNVTSKIESNRNHSVYLHTSIAIEDNVSTVEGMSRGQEEQH